VKKVLLAAAAVEAAFETTAAAVVLGTAPLVVAVGGTFAETGVAAGAEADFDSEVKQGEEFSAE